ncbi:uncharacterized protein LOC117920579 [Vitis riparia]|uniref:uncharacterized protein LOC117920579 n=1 Tax=Vitis riparia TaxID=96939 RepID=UPI00155B06AB|nr:uncharacterized protein LOC117920579 [Vitis riparia]
MVNERDIETDPNKIRVILNMYASRTERKIRGFLGRLQFISRFIARLTDICEPIFRLLRKSQPTVWDDQCQCAFERSREYLLSHLVLVPPTLGRPLLLHLSVSDIALGCMLAQLDDSGKEPALIDRLMRWLVLLTEFVIHYVTQKSIRRSIVADHLASLPVSDGRAIDDDFPDEDFAIVTSLSGWRMYFDGMVNHSGYGIGVLLISSHGDHIPRSRRIVASLFRDVQSAIFMGTLFKPQTNGAVEAANKNIKKISRRMIEASRDWPEKLLFALWAYRTSFRTSTRLYSLVYGMEAVLLVEIEMGSLRVALE